jgi:hypothetical protein
MPTVSAARGCSPTARSRRPQGVRKTKNQLNATSASANQIIRFMRPKMSPKNGMSSTSGTVIVGMRSIVGVPSVP